MTSRTPILLATALLALAACGGREAADSTDAAEAEFAALQARGAEAMGVDQYTSSHIFEDFADGGRIVLQRDSVDAAGTATIRAHMSDIAGRFADGDFTIPGMVHDQEVPGTAVMSARRARITYVVDTLPRGGQVRIITTDPEAVKAVHTFLAFQRMDHREMGHGNH